MPDSEHVFKVALFGVTGCGKSSIVNLLAGKPVANVSPGVDACTKRAQWYPISLGDKKFRLWDTMGFNQAEAKDYNPLSPYEQSHSLLRNLQDGVDLILLCARKDGINASLRSLHWLLNDFFFARQAPIALVLTHFDTSDEQWWHRNKSFIAQRCSIRVESLPHLCITTVRNGSDLAYEQSKQAIQDLLRNHTTTIPTPISLRLDQTSKNEDAAAAVERLCANCPLSTSDATTLVERFRLPKRPFRAILFGESGVGKSSLINLIVGKTVAEVSSGISGCTLDSRCHTVNAGSHQFLIWDTVGINSLNISHEACPDAIENAARLVRDLYRQGGVDLLVFCKRAGRLLRSELHTFRLFQEFLCDGQTPVAFVVTHLENEDPMDGWWKINGKELLKSCTLNSSTVTGHACVTTLAPENSKDESIQHKLTLSRESILSMLEDSISYGGTFTKDEGAWVMSFLRKLVGMIRVGNPPLRRKDRLTPNIIKDRCGLNKDQADELVKLLYAPRDTE